MSSGSSTAHFTREQLATFESANDFHIAVYHNDGTTGTPTWIWCVVVDDNPYIRSYGGAGGKWFSSALKHPRGPVRLAGRTWQVAFEHVTDDSLLDRISAEYVRKYASGADGMYVTHMNARGSRAATMRVVPVA